MEVTLDDVEISERMDEEVNSGEKITDLELEIKIEKIETIKTEIFKAKNKFESFEIIGDKRKNQETSNLEDENKKLKKNL